MPGLSLKTKKLRDSIFAAMKLTSSFCWERSIVIKRRGDLDVDASYRVVMANDEIGGFVFSLAPWRLEVQPIANLYEKRVNVQSTNLALKITNALFYDPGLFHLNNTDRGFNNFVAPRMTDSSAMRFIRAIEHEELLERAACVITGEKWRTKKI